MADPYKSGRIGVRLRGRRVVVRGAMFGLVAACALHLVYLVFNFNAAFVIWSLFNLVVFEAPVAVLIGLAGGFVAAIINRSVSGSFGRLSLLAAVIGGIVCGGLTFGLWSIVPLPGFPWLVGILGGCGMAIALILLGRQRARGQTGR
jgi:hypothetical protein